MKTQTLIPMLALMGCNPWPSNDSVMIDDLWSTDIVTLDDGVYVQLPTAGNLIRVGTDNSWQVVDLDGATPLSMRSDATKGRLLVQAQWPVCEDNDPKIKTVEDCPDNALEYKTELAIIDNGKRQAVANVPAHMNAMAFTPDGSTALVYLDDASDTTSVSGPIVDLSEVILLDLESGDTASVSVGFMPRNILFTGDGQRAVIMSRSKVVVLDLETQAITVEYPLTLDADIEVDPSAAVLTPDERYVLISIEDSNDLYKLDLEVVSIDMEALDSSPSDMSADAENGQTIFGLPRSGTGRHYHRARLHRTVQLRARRSRHRHRHGCRFSSAVQHPKRISAGHRFTRSLEPRDSRVRGLQPGCLPSTQPASRLRGRCTQAHV
jgi:hypothetical protein